MVSAPWTAVYDTPNKSVRQNVGRRGVVLHHAATTSLDALRRLAMGAKEVSATAICKDSAVELLVGDAWRPWSLGDAWGDSAFRSVECANESTAGWTISDASHWSLARAVAYWASRDGFWPHRDGAPSGWTVIGHREFFTIHGGSYATACPGAMDLGLVTARAQSILRGAVTAGDTSRPIGEDEDMALKTIQIHYTAGDGSIVRALVTPGTGYFLGWNEGRGAEIANRLAGALETGNSVQVTESMYGAFAKAADNYK